MRNHIPLALGAGLLLATGMAACDFSDLTSVNENPNNPTEAPAPALFTQATRVAAGRFLGNFDVRGLELVAQHLAEVQYPESDQYVRLQANSTTGLFDAPYYTELMDFEQVIRAGRADDQPGYWAPALVMQTWTFANLTDMFGDIPFSEALLGDSVGAEEPFQPAYDPQQEIYSAFFDRLGAATGALASPPAAALDLGSADPIYGGDFTGWQKFSNSLHARYALRIVNVEPQRADAELQAAFSAPGGLIEASEDNAMFRWPGDGVYNNPWAVNFQTRDDHRVSTRLMTYLQEWDDPRLPVYAQPTEADPDVYAGLENALTHAQATGYLTTTSRPGEIFYPGNTAYGFFGGSGASQPSYLMTAAEVQFIKAEAAERGLGGLGPASAAEYYRAGIRESMEQWGVSGSEIDAYLNGPDVSYRGGAAGLEQIAIQKWIALYSQGLQAWSEFRRTCQPAILHPGPAAIIDEIPRRFEYSTNEEAVNEAELDAAITRQGGNSLTTPVWWDTNRESAPTYEAGCGVR